MADQTVPEEDAWTEISAELHRIADDLAKLAGEPEPRYVGLDFQPYNGVEDDPGGSDAATIAATDAVAIALLGRPAKPQRMGGGSFHHTAHGARGRIRVAAFQSVSDPEAHAREAELARLRAEIEKLRAQQSGLDYSRAADGDDPQKIGQREPLHTGAVTEAGLVDETEPCWHGTNCGGGGPDCGPES